jgi:hypothetical protein
VPDVVSTILVKILGDAKGLTGALTTADAGLGGTAKKLAGGLIALGAVKLGFDALGDALDQADRLGDATSRLDLQLGALAAPLEATAGGFAKLGQSRQDMLELEATFADIGTKAGIADPLIAGSAEQVAKIAAAASLLGDQDAATIVDEIGKAAAGSSKPLGDLGVSLELADVQARALADTGKTSAKSLTDNELAAARLELILEQLQPKLDDVTGSSADLEGGQRALQARIETLSGSIGDKLSPAMAGVLQFINDEIDAIPGAIQGWQLLGKAIEDFGRFALGPLGNVRDALGGIGDLQGNIIRQLGVLVGVSEADVQKAQTNHDERNGLSRAGGP